MIQRQALVAWCPAFVDMWILINETADSLCCVLPVEETELKPKQALSLSNSSDGGKFEAEIMLFPVARKILSKILKFLS